MAGFGFGMRATARRRKAGSSGSTPVAAPGYLNTGVTPPWAVWGAHRLVSGYAGNLFTLRRASDGATLDVAPLSGGDYPDYAAISTWIGVSTATVTTLYDQSGNGRNLAQATVAEQPAFDPAMLTGNAAPILFDGYNRGSGTTFLANATKTASMYIDGISLDRSTLSVFGVVAPKCSYNSMGFWAGTENGGFTSNLHEFYLQNGNETVKNNTTSGGSASTGGLRTSKGLVNYTISGTQFNFWHKEAVRTNAQTNASTTFGRFTLGKVIFGVGVGAYRLFGMAVYDSFLATAGVTPAVQSAFTTACEVQTTFDYTVVFEGDSILEGSGAVRLKNTVHYMGLRKEGEVFNYAIHGGVIDYSTRTKYAPLYNAGRPCVIFIQAGTNDLFGGTTGSDLYNNTTTPFIAYLKGLGFKVVVCTILPRDGSTSWTAGMETQRLAYNALVVANGGGADLVLDLAADSVMGPSSAPADTNLYGDKLHPADGGHARLGPLYKAALQTVLRTTALGGSYVP